MPEPIFPTSMGDKLKTLCINRIFHTDKVESPDMLITSYKKTDFDVRLDKKKMDCIATMSICKEREITPFVDSTRFQTGFASFYAKEQPATVVAAGKGFHKVSLSTKISGSTTRYPHFDFLLKKTTNFDTLEST